MCLKKDTVLEIVRGYSNTVNRTILTSNIYKGTYIDTPKKLGLGFGSG